MAAIETYLDESFNLDAPVRVFAVGGWYGTAETWRALEGDWVRLLHFPCPAIKEFATQDCYNGIGEFELWSRSRRLEYIDRFVEVAEHHDIRAVVCIGLFEGPPPPVKHFDYYYCLFLTMQTLAFMADNCAIEDRVSFFVDRRDKFRAVAEEAHRDLYTRDEPIARRVGPLKISESHEVIPLQTADLLAHAAFRSGREMADGRAATVSGRRVGLNPLVDKIAFQQYYRWDGHKRELWLLRDSPTHPDGEWVRWS